MTAWVRTCAALVGVQLRPVQEEERREQRLDPGKRKSTGPTTSTLPMRGISTLDTVS